MHSLKKESFSNFKIRRHEAIGFELPFISNFVLGKDCPPKFKEYFWDLFPKGIDSLINEPFEEGIMHGDLYYDNTLFKGKSLITLLDFEQAGLGPLILDLGISISGTSILDGKISTSLVENFVGGYEKERLLSNIEKKSLNSFYSFGLIFNLSLENL